MWKCLEHGGGHDWHVSMNDYFFLFIEKPFFKKFYFIVSVFKDSFFKGLADCPLLLAQASSSLFASKAQGGARGLAQKSPGLGCAPLGLFWPLERAQGPPLWKPAGAFCPPPWEGGTAGVEEERGLPS